MEHEKLITGQQCRIIVQELPHDDTVDDEANVYQVPASVLLFYTFMYLSITFQMTAML